VSADLLQSEFIPIKTTLMAQSPANVEVKSEGTIIDEWRTLKSNFLNGVLDLGGVVKLRVGHEG